MHDYAIVQYKYEKTVKKIKHSYLVYTVQFQSMVPNERQIEIYLIKGQINSWKVLS